MAKKKKKKKVVKKKAAKKPAKKKAVKKKTPKKSKKTAPKEEKGRRQSMAEVMGRHADFVATKSIYTPEQFTIFSFPRLFTGIIDIDLMLRPTIGKRVCLIGEESVGKSLTSHVMEGAAQHTCRQCYTPIIPWVNEETGEIIEACWCRKNDPCTIIHIDVEDSFDPWWARAWGVRIDDHVFDKDKNELGYSYRKSSDDSLFVIIPDDMEKTFNFAEDAVMSGAIDFVITDSLAMIVPKADITRQNKIVSVGDPKVGARAKLVGSGLSRLIRAQIKAKKDLGAKGTLIWTNQYYSGPTKSQWESPNKPAAGIRARHAADHTMHFFKPSAEKKGKKDTSAMNYTDIRFKASKSKSAGTAGGRGEFRVYLDDSKTKYGILTAGDTDEPDRMMTYLSDLGLFLRPEETGKKCYTCLGREFKLVRDINSFLKRRDIQYIARYFIYRELLPVSALAYLERDHYDYSPFGRDIAFKLFAPETQEPTDKVDTPEKASVDREEDEEEGFDPFNM